MTIVTAVVTVFRFLAPHWGVLHVKHERRAAPVSRLLRTVLLGGTAAVAWLALSTTAASADSGAGSMSGTDSLSPVTAGLSPAVLDGSLLDPLASEGIGPDLPYPAVGNPTGAVDQLAASLPAAGTVLPAGPVSGLAEPVVNLVDSSLTETATAVVPAVTGLVPVAAPVLDPIGTILTETPAQAVPIAPPVAPPVGPAPAEPAAVVVPTPAPDGPALSGAGGPADLAPQTSEHSDAAASQAARNKAGSGRLSGAMSVPEAPRASALAAPAVPVLPADGAPGKGPDPLPAGPGSGTGSGPSLSGPGAPAACETSALLILPPLGADDATESVQQIPQPVAFDPGSSPD